MSRGQPLSSMTSLSSITSAPSFPPMWWPPPSPLVGEQEGVSHRIADGKADRVLEVGIGERLDEAMGGPRPSRPDQDRVEHQSGISHLLRGRARTSWHGPDHLLEQFEVVVEDVARSSVARAQHGGQRLVGVVAPRRQRVEPEAVLIRGGDVLWFSACTFNKVESKSQIIGPSGGWRRPETPCRGRSPSPPRWPQLDRGRACTARQAVATDATGPKRSSCSLRAAMSAKQSAPSARYDGRMGQERRSPPGSWVCHEIHQCLSWPPIWPRSNHFDRPARPRAQHRHG